MYKLAVRFRKLHRGHHLKSWCHSWVGPALPPWSPLRGAPTVFCISLFQVFVHVDSVHVSLWKHGPWIQHIENKPQSLQTKDVVTSRASVRRDYWAKKGLFLFVCLSVVEKELLTSSWNIQQHYSVVFVSIMRTEHPGFALEGLKPRKEAHPLGSCLWESRIWRSLEMSSLNSTPSRGELCERMSWVSRQTSIHQECLNGCSFSSSIILNKEKKNNCCTINHCNKHSDSSSLTGVITKSRVTITGHGQDNICTHTVQRANMQMFSRCDVFHLSCSPSEIRILLC